MLKHITPGDAGRIRLKCNSRENLCSGKTLHFGSVAKELYSAKLLSCRVKLRSKSAKLLCNQAALLSCSAKLLSCRAELLSKSARLLCGLARLLC
ncbi:hypothetical protein [Candidatus Electronema sp. PJ]|uniref:hypothetical protein n=1 Tax=Candidatus Electronema sp. PJ TaxID=3401572 RepID=UPI003AA909B1